eukprot:6195030-Pleurochrysis_carterae.AAC.1
MQGRLNVQSKDGATLLPAGWFKKYALLVVQWRGREVRDVCACAGYTTAPIQNNSVWEGRAERCRKLEQASISGSSLPARFLDSPWRRAPAARRGARRRERRRARRGGRWWPRAPSEARAQRWAGAARQAARGAAAGASSAASSAADCVAAAQVGGAAGAAVVAAAGSAAAADAQAFLGRHASSSSVARVEMWSAQGRRHCSRPGHCQDRLGRTLLARSPSRRSCGGPD